MNTDCVKYVYEKDTGLQYCADEDKDYEYGCRNCQNCPEYYSKADAKADTKITTQTKRQENHNDVK